MGNRYDNQVNFVAPAVVKRLEPAHDLTGGEVAIVNQSQQMAGSIMHSGAQSSHIRQDDDAISHAKASLLYSMSYGVAMLFVTAGMLLIVYLFRGGDAGWYFFSGMLFWGISVIVVLHRNRAQGLHHSSTGVAHHEIDAKVQVAMYAIDRHAQMLERKWGVDERRAAIEIDSD